MPGLTSQVQRSAAAGLRNDFRHWSASAEVASVPDHHSQTGWFTPPLGNFSTVSRMTTLSMIGNGPSWRDSTGPPAGSAGTCSRGTSLRRACCCSSPPRPVLDPTWLRGKAAAHLRTSGFRLELARTHADFAAAPGLPCDPEVAATSINAPATITKILRW
jgi:hypothetical protein